MVKDHLVVLALFLLLAASPTFEETFRAGLLALQRNALNSHTPFRACPISPLDATPALFWI